jgi:adenosylmethionine-8-amino-7-oxononanoate aminotransferase
VIVKNADTIAAVIVEPVCQGAVGMRIYPPEHTAELRRVCSECDVLMILDEIAVGFGRTVRMFASELAGVVPDMMCVEKGLTGGTLIPSLTK